MHAFWPKPMPTDRYALAYTAPRAIDESALWSAVFPPCNVVQIK